MSNKIKYYFIETWGCQMNEEDSQKIAGMLYSMGYNETLNRKDADIIVFNTCCIRENAELKVYGNIGALKNQKKQNPELIIVLSGCMMQQNDLPQKIIKKYPFVDIIIGTHNLHKLPEYINNVNMSNSSIIDIWDKEESIEEDIPIIRKNKTKALVTIMYGCNNFCTYCIVPYVRGRERSRRPENIINEIKALGQEGYKEITLLGQNVNSYGKDLNYNNMNFAKLLEMINEIDGIERIRFMTSHPKDISDELIYAMKNLNKVCKHIHLPLQAGSSRILNLMNRHYTKERYIEIVDKIKREIPNIAITTDIIVGFPGESEEDFNDTLDMVKYIKFDSAFTFLYSKREGTPAQKFEEQISEDIKHKRFNILLDTINDISYEKNLEYKDKIVKVLIEDLSKNDENNLMGRTDTGKLVNIISNSHELIGNTVNVKIIECQTWSLKGIII